ncbi:histidine phosphatase family protein [Alloscardovia criceti]|uniref:histidine phosphatase family protein n=1 Tax=Alloscardovia criceti TaxID=356828 RepID=UPI00036CAF3C|nr:histidine phosphatase family protein [Alloscardovia criceti]
MTIHVYLVRHGQTYFNLYNRLQGWSNSPLTDKGKQDAVVAAHKLEKIRFDAAFCSDTQRAIETARIILARNDAARHDGLYHAEEHMEFREQFYGYFEGKDMNEAWWAAGAPHGATTYAQILEKFGSAATKDFLKEADPFHHAENEEEYWERIERGYHIIRTHDKISQLTAHGTDAHVLLISHGNSLLSIVQRFAHSAPDGIDMTVRPRNGSVTRMDFNPEESAFDHALSIQGYNE